MNKRYVVESVFEHEGYVCVVVFGDLGFRCGYVGMPKEHPLYNVDYNAIYNQIDVHGGLTYSGGSADYPIASDGLWWFGFDCGHAWDGLDYELAAELFPYNRKFYDNAYMTEGQVCSLEYVAAECRSLAEQLKEFEQTN